MKAHDSQLWSYATRELEVGEHRLIQSHLEECPECVEQLEAVHLAREAITLAREAQPRVDWARADQRMGALVEKRLRQQARKPLYRRMLFVGGGLVAVAATALFLSMPKPGHDVELVPVLVNEPSIPSSSWARVDRSHGLTRLNGGGDITDGSELAVGDVIRTSKKGLAFVHLPDRSHLRIGGNSQLALTRSEGDDVALTLERGRLAVRASHEKRKDFVVHSGGVSVHVIGTVFAVTNDADVIEVSVSEGKVKVELPTGETTYVEPGQRLQFNTRGNATKQLKLNTMTERELAEVMAADETASAVEHQAMVPAVGGGSPSVPPMINAQGTPRTLPRISQQDARARIAAAPETPPIVETPRTEVTLEAPVESAPSAPEEWATVPQPEVKSVARLQDQEEAPLAPPKTISKDLESIFLGRAEASLGQGTCDRFMLGLEDLAMDSQKSLRTEQARVLRARCFDTQMRPRQALNEYRKYIEEYPHGRYVTEAKQAFGE